MDPRCEERRKPSRPRYSRWWSGGRSACRSMSRYLAARSLTGMRCDLRGLCRTLILPCDGCDQNYPSLIKRTTAILSKILDQMPIIAFCKTIHCGRDRLDELQFPLELRLRPHPRMPQPAELHSGLLVVDDLKEALGSAAPNASWNLINRRRLPCPRCSTGSSSLSCSRFRRSCSGIGFGLTGHPDA